MKDTTHEPLPDDFDRGVCCLECQSVIFNVSKLLKHLHERPGHRWFKSGDDIALRIEYMRDVDVGAVSHYNYLLDKEGEGE